MTSWSWWGSRLLSSCILLDIEGTKIFHFYFHFVSVIFPLLLSDASLVSESEVMRRRLRPPSTVNGGIPTPKEWSKRTFTQRTFAKQHSFQLLLGTFSDVLRLAIKEGLFPTSPLSLFLLKQTERYMCGISTFGSFVRFQHSFPAAKILNIHFNFK